jgi:hypothetical protein
MFSVISSAAGGSKTLLQDALGDLLELDFGAARLARNVDYLIGHTQPIDGLWVL